MKPLVCSNCGANLQPEEGARVMTCPYCGTTYDLGDEEAVREPDIPLNVQVTPTAQRNSSKKAVWIVTLVSIFSVLVGVLPVLMMKPDVRRALQSTVIRKLLRPKPYRYCTVNADGDQIPDVLFYSYERKVVLLNGRDGSVMTTVDSGAKELPSDYLCLPYSMMAVQKDDGRYEIFALQQDGKHIQILTSIIDPADSIESYAQGKGCVALKDKGGTFTYLAPPGRKISGCTTKGPFKRVYELDTNIYDVDSSSPAELKSGTGLIYQLTVNSSSMVFLEARKILPQPKKKAKKSSKKSSRHRHRNKKNRHQLIWGRTRHSKAKQKTEKLYHRRLRYKTLFISKIGAVVWKGNPYLIVTDIDKSKKSIGSITGNAVLLAIDGKTGKIMWRHVFDSGSSPGLDLFELHGSRLYAGFYSDGIKVFDLKSGQVLWSYWTR